MIDPTKPIENKNGTWAEIRATVVVNQADRYAVVWRDGTGKEFCEVCSKEQLNMYYRNVPEPPHYEPLDEAGMRALVGQAVNLESGDTRLVVCYFNRVNEVNVSGCGLLSPAALLEQHVTYASTGLPVGRQVE